MIGFTEDTGKDDGYNETLAYGAYSEGDVNLVSITFDELDALQMKMLKHPKNKAEFFRMRSLSNRPHDSSEHPRATTLEGLALFDEGMQDRMARFLPGQCGIGKYLAARLSEDTRIDNPAKEWPSLPTTAGKGNCRGQHTAVTTLKVRSDLVEVTRRSSKGSRSNCRVRRRPPSIRGVLASRR
ncbi:hypothetical protein [Neorhizobium sp. DT-125]|uniref:hypothetical protein n=1 Tax=Neorhizobium sp. DT-125 TaxID=3396163 RepID=UPI003F1C2CEE